MGQTSGRYRRNEDIPGFGARGQARLRAARVLMVGAGGLGSPAGLYLTAAGIGHLGIVDHDVVEVSNLQRQVLFDTVSEGENKAVAAGRRLAALNPDADIRTYPVALDPVTGPALVAAHDLVLDCTDTFAAKLMISDLARDAGKPLVWGAAVSMTYQVSVFGVPDARGRVLYLRDLYPAEPDPSDYPRAVDAGVLGAMVGQAGSAMAAEAIKVLAGFGVPLAGRVLVADVAAGRWDVVTIGPGR